MSSTTTLADEHVLIARQASLGRIRLNRPKALNSLTIEMVRAIVEALRAFEADSAIATVLIDGLGERGLCAGGDIRALYESGKRGDGAAETFLRAEYAMNAYIAGYTKPYVAFMDGITMGGGVGVSAHGSHRVVTERTRLAMPEAGIGFFPDIGATWLLARAPGEIGIYLGLTGIGVNGADAIYAGLADVLVASDALPAIATGLSALPPGATHDAVRAVIDAFAQPVAAALAARRDGIDKNFAYDDAALILRALDEDGSEFSRATAAAMRKNSPTSLVLALELLRRGRASAGLAECLDRETRAAAKILHGVDFYEGVRAAIIDKDRQPRWHPAALAEIDRDALLALYLGE